MENATLALATSYDMATVVLSYAIAAIASYTALELASRVSATQGAARRGWLLAGALVMGAGIWSMHFTGMQAFHLGIPTVYDLLTTLGSLAIAVLASGIAFQVLSGPALGRWPLAIAGSAIGLGIAAMHYTGMAAMRMQAVVRFEPALVLVSVLVAIAAAHASLWLAFRLRGEGLLDWSWKKVGSAALMGGAIGGMHYTGMAAASFHPLVCSAPSLPTVNLGSLGTGMVGACTVLLLLLVLLGASRDQARREHAALTALQGENAEIGKQVAHRTRELASQTALLERLIGNAPAAIAHLDRGGLVQRANPEFARMAGLPAAQLLGRPILSVFPGAAEPLGGCLAGGGEPARPRAFRVSLPAGGRSQHWDLTCVPLTADDGSPEGHLLLATDATERVENEQLQREKLDALETADAAKDQFLSLLSHELRTPINAVTGFGSILQDELMGNLNAEQHELLAKMLHSADALLDLVNDLLEMTFIQAGRVELMPSPIDFAEVSRHVLARLEDRAREKRLQFEVELAEDLPLVQADDLRVEQTLMHLVGNAIKFTPQDGTIYLRAYTAGDNLVCEVEDTGDGIEPDALPRLFQRFTQLDMSATRTAGGTGLGLSIAKALVEAHGGTIGVRSVPGQGSTFWFTLPLVAVPVRGV